GKKTMNDRMNDGTIAFPYGFTMRMPAMISTIPTKMAAA
ncbi:unnamed protein product, partial [marine sediment metagenome]